MASARVAQACIGIIWCRDDAVSEEIAEDYHWVEQVGMWKVTVIYFFLF